MFKGLPLLMLTGLMSGCASAPDADDASMATRLLQVSCYQAGWQAETVPVIYKRGGVDALDSAERALTEEGAGCR